VVERAGVRYIDDSISTNPDTAIAAIRAFEEPKIVILGGSDKGNDYTELTQVIATTPSVKYVYLIGQMASRIAQGLQDAGFDRYSQKHKDLAQVVQDASKMATEGDIVLLSPACASFDMFRSYAERGDSFAQIAKSL
jgi:UDP-N-acetylmuramoylalanine--D-glutamate ligase